jgi:cytochrome d ubiquinol oxidase subunit II
MDLPLFSALFIVFAVSLYVLLDGFDLGVGALLLTQTDKERRDRMIDSILPTWDGNETWLIMAGVGLLAAFPIAYGILLPAFYLPLVVMLLALGLRGVSFEFRYQVQRGRRDWDIPFGLGSIIAALMQGIIVGGLIQGVTLAGQGFGGNVFDVFQPFALLVAAALLCGYIVLGAAWLHLKGTEAVRDFAKAGLRWGAPFFMLLSAVTCVAAVYVQPGVRAAWTNHGPALALICTLFLAILATLLRCIGGKSDGLPFALVIIAFALGIAGLGIAVFPDIVPFRMTIWAAASGTSSHVFLLIGAIIVTPIVLAYSAFAYHVFRGKIPAKGWEQ